MLSKKMTFSLMSLITLLAFAFVAPSVMAVDFKVTIEGPKVVTYATANVGNPIGGVDNRIYLMVTSEEALFDPLTTAVAANAGADPPVPAVLGNITGSVRDNRGFITPLSADNGVAIMDDSVIPVGDAAPFTGRTVKRRRLSVKFTPRLGAEGTPIIDEITITIPAFETPDTRVGDLHDMSIAVTHTILVREEGDVDYDPEDANVVSIQRLRPGSQSAVATFLDEEISPDPFNIRIVLTEMRFDRVALADKTPDELAKELVAVGGGEASNLRVGTPLRTRT